MTINPADALDPISVAKTIAADEELARHRQKIARITLDALEQMTGLLDAAGNVIEIHGIAASEVEGRLVWTAPCWRSKTEELHEAVRRAASGETARCEIDVSGAGGDVATVELTLRPQRDEHGTIAFIALEGQDVTRTRALEREVAAQRLEIERLKSGATTARPDAWRTSQDETVVATEERFRLAAKGARLGAWDWDLKDRVVWSETLEEIYGFAPGTFPGTLQAFVGCLHPDDRERIYGEIQQALSNRTDMEIEERIVLPSGETRWLHSRAKLILGADGAPSRMVGICMDITERKHAEVALAEAHEKLVRQTELLNTVQSVGDAVARELDLDAAVQAVTDKATKLTEAEFGAFFYNVVDDAGESYTLFTLSGADRSKFENFGLPRATPLFKPTFDGNGPMRIDDVHKDPRYGHVPPHYGMPKGHLPVHSYLAVPVISRGGVVLGGLFFGHSNVGVFTETHEELALGVAHWAALALENARLYDDARQATALVDREREDLYAMLMQSPVPIAVFHGHDLICELANAPVMQVLPGADLIGRPLMEAAPELRATGFDEQMRRVMETGEPLVLTERLIELPGEGHTRETYWNYSFTPLREPDGTIGRVMALGVEVTEEVLARREMQAAITLKDQFLGLVSHELRTPISTVVANALILLRRGELLEPEDRQQALEDIAGEGAKLQKVIENLLMLTRMEATRGLGFEPLQVDSVIAGVTEDFARQNPTREVNIQLEGSATISGQEDLIGIVMSNLLGNAHKYSPPGTPVEVIARRTATEFEVHVRDSGIGIEEDDLANLFVPFFRTMNARGYAPGMGLGLAVSKRIIEAHGGRIWVSRRPEGGSDFTFVLPLVEGVST